MKIAVTATGPGTDSAMDERLGRCPYFIILDTVSGEMESLKNDAAEASSGAGTKAMQTLVDKGVNVVITGRIGPHASAMIEDAGMEFITGKSGRVQHVLDDFKKTRGI